MELIERQEYQKAFAFLNRRLKPMEATAASTPNEFLNLCYLLTCKSVSDADHFRSWGGVLGGREKLAEELARFGSKGWVWVRVRSGRRAGNRGREGAVVSFVERFVSGTFVGSFRVSTHCIPFISIRLHSLHSISCSVHCPVFMSRRLHIYACIDLFLPCM